MATKIEPVESTLKRLVSKVRLGVKFSKFALYFAECSLSTQQDKYISQLQTKCLSYDISLEHIDISHQIVDNLLEYLLKYLHKKYNNEIPKNVACVLTGLEASILLDSNEKRPAVLQIMNLSREQYPESFSRPLIIFMSEKMITKTQLIAPDFWSWRSGEPEQFENLMIKDEIEKLIPIPPINDWEHAIQQVSFLERLQEALNELSEYDQVKNEIYKGLGNAYKFLEKFSKARFYYEYALKTETDAQKKAGIFNNLGIVLRELNDPEQALKYFKNFAESEGEKGGQGAALNNIGLIYLDMNQHDNAITTLNKALEINRNNNNLEAESDTLGNLGLVYQVQGQAEIAIKYQEQALQISKRLENSSRKVKDMLNLGLSYTARGEHIAAFGYYLLGRRESEDVLNEKECLLKLAECVSEEEMDFILTGYFGKGTRILQELLTEYDLYSGPIDDIANEELFEILRSIDHESSGISDESKKAFSKNRQIPLAESYYSQVLKIVRKIQDEETQYEIFYSMAKMYQEENLDRASEYFEQALQTAEKLADVKKEISCLKSLICLRGMSERDKTKGYIKQARQRLVSAGYFKGAKIGAVLNSWIDDKQNEQPVLAMDKKYVLYINILRNSFITGYEENKPSIPKIFSDWICEINYNFADELLNSQNGIKGLAKLTEAPHADNVSVESDKSVVLDAHNVDLEQLSEKDGGVVEDDNSELKRTLKLDTEEQVIPKRTEQQAIPLKTDIIDKEGDIELKIKLEGQGFEYNVLEQTLITSWNQIYEPIFFIIKPKEIGMNRISANIEVDKVPYEINMRMNVVEPKSSDKIVFSDNNLYPVKNKLGMEFAYIPPGEFMMGSPEDEPERYDDEVLHHVTISKGFYMGTTTVTQGQWKAVMGNNPSSFKDDGDEYPVETISWDDANEFIKKLNTFDETGKYRLPTEAEWEYACRAGTETPFYFGECLSTNQANYDGNYPMTNCPKGVYRKKTVPVASFEPNSWGLYDMHGNVRELCEDVYIEKYLKDSVTDPVIQRGSSGLRVARGGSWYYSARYCRSASRSRFRPGIRNFILGARLVFLRGQ